MKPAPSNKLHGAASLLAFGVTLLGGGVVLTAIGIADSFGGPAAMIFVGLCVAAFGGFVACAALVAAGVRP